MSRAACPFARWYRASASRFLISSSPNCSCPFYSERADRRRSVCLRFLLSRVGCVPPAFNVSIAMTHTANLRAEGDALCASCHQSDVYETPLSSCASAFSECGMCGLPHARRDVYGRRLQAGSSVYCPDPVLAKELGARDVCQDCHEDRFIAWRKLRKKPKKRCYRALSVC